MRNIVRAKVAILILLLASTSLAVAQPDAPPGVPPGMASRLAAAAVTAAACTASGSPCSRHQF